MSYKLWDFSIPVPLEAGYRMLIDGEPIPKGAECYMECTWAPVGPSAHGRPYEEPIEGRSTYHFPMRVKIKLPEPPAPKSLSLDEILADQAALASEDSADVLRYEASFRHGASEAQGWTARAEVSTDLPKHDGHYRTLEAKGAEPIERMEALVCRGIPEDLHRIAKRNLNMAMASKHQDRAGEKSGEAWEKELQKAENYLHRAWSGRWIG